jgi:hypothetical protein
MKTLTNLQTIDATRRPGHGNRAHRRLLSLFRESPARGQLEAVPSFRPRWLGLIATAPGTAEALAWRLSKLSNRPRDRQCPPSWQTFNNWIYEPGSLSRCQLPL